MMFILGPCYTLRWRTTWFLHEKLCILQSIMALVFRNCLNAFGRFSVTCSRDGHEIRNFNSANGKLIHVVNILLISDGWTLSRSFNTSTSKPLLRRIRVIHNSSLLDSFLFGPTILCYKTSKKQNEKRVWSLLKVQFIYLTFGMVQVITYHQYLYNKNDWKSQSKTTVRHVRGTN